MPLGSRSCCRSPTVVLSGVYQLGDAVGGDGPGLTATLVATAVSFIAGYASIAWLLRWLTTHTFTTFFVYRVRLGVLIWVLLAVEHLEPVRRSVSRRVGRRGSA
jgi:undecaprenyl-diphosphatase